MGDKKSEFELMKEDVMLYLDSFFRQRGLEKSDYISDKIKSINNIHNFDIFNYLVQLKDKDSDTKNILPDLYSVISFEGSLKEFRGFLAFHKEFLGFEKKESTNEYTSFVLYSHHISNLKTAQIKIYTKLSEEDMWKLLQSNIKYCFLYQMEPCIYSAPFDVDHDKETGIYLSREREIIFEYLIKKKTSIDWTKVRKEYNSIGVNRDISGRHIRINFTNTKHDTNKKSSNSFNVIYVFIPLITYGRSRKDLIIYISNHRSEFDKIALSYIEHSSRFKKSGLTMNYFELDSLTLTSAAELLYVFDIKKKLR